MANGKHEFAATADYAPSPVAAQEPPVPAPAAAVDRREFVRFSRLYRTLHACMVVSFLTLAVTGLSLKFSYTGWAVRLSRLLGGFERRARSDLAIRRMALVSSRFDL